MGLIPGVSTKQDADRILGKPIKEVKKGIRYDYDPKPFRAGRISILFDAHTRTIEFIDLYFKQKHDKSWYRNALKLKKPSGTDIDDEERLIEFYETVGISLYYDGPKNTYPIRYFSHYDTALFEQKEEKSIEGGGYLGVQISTKQGVPGIKIVGVDPKGPAHRAGLQGDDIILELEGYQLYKHRDALHHFQSLIARTPGGKPLRFLIKRGNREFELIVTLENRNWVGYYRQAENCYLGKAGFKKDYAKAAEYYRKAANEGHDVSMYRLGRMYEQGKGLKKDFRKAFYWYQKAADKGHVSAMFHLGVFYDNGQGIPKDEQKATSWYQKAADKGHVSAMYNLGLSYDNGEGVPKDNQKALYWYQKAANKSHIKAMNNLGCMYRYGEGVSKNYKKAFYWYQKAADKGHVLAMYNIGTLYNSGKGVPKDNQKALYWFKKAAKQGGEMAQKELRKRGLSW